ncbi:hypothetical protein ACTXT7_009888 [Hymenolepis weldensis]
MANYFITPTLTKHCVNDLTPEVAKLVYDVLEKQSTTPYDDLKFAILKSIEKLKLEYSTWLHNELMNGDGGGLQPQERNNSDPDSPLTDSDGSSSIIITPEMAFESE